jgi:hypothetical protein
MSMNKQEAIRNVIVEAQLSAAEVQLRYPGLAGQALAFSMLACAAHQVHFIAAYCPVEVGA